MQAFGHGIDAVPVAVAVLDPESGAVLVVNDSFCALFGYDAATVCGEDTSLFAAGAESDLATPERIRRARDGGRAQFEWCAETADGAELPVSVALSSTRLDGESVIVAAFGECQEHRAREQELAAARDRYEMLFENNPIVIWEHDLSAAKAYVDDLAATVEDLAAYLDTNPEELEAIMSRVESIDVNENAVDYYRAESKAQVLENLDGVMGEEAWELTRDLWCSVAAGETRFRGETVARTFDGERRHQILELHVPAAHADDYSRAYITGTDITERKRREHELRAIYDAREALQESLADSTSLDAFANAVCSELTAMDSIPFARVAAVGPGDTIDTLAIAGDTDALPEDPAVAAAREGTSRRVKIDDAVVSEAFAEPISRDGVTRGVLVAGLDAQQVLGANRLSDLITESADVLGYAMEATERRRALSADEQVELTIAVDADTPLSRAVARSGLSATVTAAVPRDENSVLCYVTVTAEDVDSVVTAARDTDGIERVGRVGDGDPVRLQVITAGPVPSTVVAERGGIVVDATVRSGETTLTVRVPQRQTFNPVLDALSTQFSEPRVSAFTTAPADTPETDPLSTLTDRQRDVLQAAHNAGYFEQPRTQSATEVADSLGVSRQAFDQVLRAAHRNLLAALFDDV
jgi:PAS domain S-box-containing protein